MTRPSVEAVEVLVTVTVNIERDEKDNTTEYPAEMESGSVQVRGIHQYKNLSIYTVSENLIRKQKIW